MATPEWTMTIDQTQYGHEISAIITMASLSYGDVDNE